MGRIDDHNPASKGVRGLFLGGCALLAAALAAILVAAFAVTPSADAQGRQFFGVSPQGSLGPGDYSRMRRGGIGTLRLQITWREAEPSPGSYQWAATDRVIGDAAARGIRSLPYIQAPPDHVRNPPTRARDRRALRSFMRRLAARYGPRGAYWRGPFRSQHPGNKPHPVRSWQIWNEQNGIAFWRERANPRAYGRLVRAAARGVRSQNRRAEIVLGGMFGTPSGKGSIISWRFLKRLYRVKGIRRAFNTVGLHPYSPNLRGIRIQVRRIRNVMRRNNSGGKGIRVTEIGWGSARGSHSLLKGPKGQARMLRRSFRLLIRRRGAWNIRGLNWFSWQDGVGGCAFCPSAGLFSGPEGDRTPKRSWRAFRRTAR